MKTNELGKIPIHDFLEKILEEDGIIAALKKERQESKNNLSLLDQRKELLKIRLGYNE